MSDEGSLGGFLLICLFVSAMGLMFYDIGFLQPQRVEAVELRLKADGFSIQDVTINSPNVYFEIDDYDEFKQILQEQGSTTVHFYSNYYYIFNSDYTLAWRIPLQSIFEGIKTK